MINPFSTKTESIVLALLQDGEKYGLELIKASGGKLKRGTIYVTLGRLEERGLVKSRTDKKAEHPGLPRPLYRLTDAGKRVLEAWELVHNQGAKQS